ncbi:VOC family protein [Aneurinibacillus terranovensis]|uniref:VOC family protein n=1 Tax=Aneurinibacillus terranovensis TaxID=278991 RepID=UPI000481A04C
MHHIGIVVRNLEQALLFYRDVLGLPFEGIEHHSGANVDIAFLRSGETLIELLEPKGEGSFRDFLEIKGEGLHYIALRVEDIAGTLEILKANNAPLLDQSPRDGGRGSKIAFLDTVSTSDVSIELVQP